MERTITRLKIFFLGLFMLSTAATAVYHVLWVRPARTCQEHGGWWSNRHRECGFPIDISELTGRPIGSPPVTPAAPPQP